MKKITKNRNRGKYIFLFLLSFSANSAIAQFFTEVASTPFTATNDSTHAFADIDGDGDLDLLILGDDGSSFIAELFRNDGLGGYTLITGTPFTGVERGDAVFGDVDGDLDLDLIISGDDGPGQITQLFLNDGTGVFTESTTHSFSGVRGNSALAMADVDGDSDLDVMLSGWDGSTRVTELHINNGSGVFTLDTATSFSAFDGGSIDFADVDGDKDLDVLLTGKESISGKAKTELYINNGSGVFTKDITTSFTGVRSSDAKFADIDGDSDQDVIISGWDENAGITEIYTNDGLGVFTLHLTLEGFTTPRLDFADVDSDSDLDLFISGKQSTSGVAETELYLNDGSGNFSITTDSFIGTRSGDIKSADIDGDGDMDVIISGWDEASRTVKLYTNDFTILGVEEFLANDIKIYPNPTRDILNINSKSNQLINAIQVFDLLGRMVEDIKMINNTIDMSHLNPGVYLLKLNLDNSSITKRIIKK